MAWEARGRVWLLVGESGHGEVVVADHGDVVADKGGVVEEGDLVCVSAGGRGEFAGVAEDEAVPVDGGVWTYAGAVVEAEGDERKASLVHAKLVAFALAGVDAAKDSVGVA